MEGAVTYGTPQGTPTPKVTRGCPVSCTLPTPQRSKIRSCSHKCDPCLVRCLVPSAPFSGARSMPPPLAVSPRIPFGGILRSSAQKTPPRVLHHTHRVPSLISSERRHAVRIGSVERDAMTPVAIATYVAALVGSLPNRAPRLGDDPRLPSSSDRCLGGARGHV